jgi:hypothetical protein
MYRYVSSKMWVVLVTLEATETLELHVLGKLGEGNVYETLLCL